MDNEKILHGNQAKIKTDKKINPRFQEYVPNNNTTHNDAVYNRLGDDAEFCKKEVDDNKK